MFSAKYDRTRNCVLMGPGMENWLTRSGLRRFSAWLRPPGREDAVGKERVRSTPMPEPFSAIRDVAASRRRALGAQARTSANGRGIDVLRGWFVEALWGPSLALPFLKCPPRWAAVGRDPRAPCFQLTLKKLQFLYFIGMSSFLVKATSVE